MAIIYLLEGGQRSKDRSSNPDGVLPLGRSNDLDLHGGRSQGGDLLLHPVSDTGVHGGTSREDGVGIKVLPDVNIALHDGVIGGFMDSSRFHTWDSEYGHCFDTTYSSNIDNDIVS